MNTFNTPTKSSRFTKYRTLMVTLAIVLIGGVGFAATGGAETLKKMFVFINIGGEVSEFEVDENSEATWTFQTEESGEATVHLRSMTEPDGEWSGLVGEDGEAQVKSVEVLMTRDDLQSDTTIDVEIAGTPPGSTVVIEPCQEGTFDPIAWDDDQAVAETIKRLVGDHDGAKTVRILRRNAEGCDEDENVLLPSDVAAATGDGERKVRVLRTKIAAEGDEGTQARDVNVEVDENGLATVRITNPDGTEKVMEMQLDTRGAEGVTEVEIEIEAGSE